MIAPLFLLAAAAGAVGRLVVGAFVCSWQALLVANVAGSALLGYLVASDVSPMVLTVVGTGFCGALTTFSSFALEVRTRGWRWGGVYAAVTIGCACGAASLAASIVAS